MGSKIESEADPFAWLDLIPEDVEVPAGYREALLAERAAAARHEQIGRSIAAAEAVVAAGAADAELDPARLVGAASNLSGLRVIREFLPPIPVVPDVVHEAIAAGLALRVPDLSPGRPPLAAIDTLHHIIVHSGQRELPPVIAPQDRDAVKVFEAACAAGISVVRTANALAQPLHGPLADRVRAWADFRAGALAEHVRILVALRQSVDAIDAERIASGRAHRCPLWGGATVDYDRVPAGVAWSVEWAMRGNGRPPRAARTLVSVGS